MARTFRRQRQAHPIADLNVTNLIDLGFTLLIIFMIATPLINQEQTSQVNLPTSAKREQQTPDKNLTFQVITVTKDGAYLWGSQPVTYSELMSKLNAVAEKPNPPVFRIRGDGDTTWKKVFGLLDEIQRRGMSKVTFDSQSGS